MSLIEQGSGPLPIQDIVAAAKNGNELPFENLVSKYDGYVKGVVRKIVGPDDDALGAVFDDVWFNVYRNPPVIPDEQRWFQWLKIVAKNSAINHLRKRFVSGNKDESFELPNEETEPIRTGGINNFQETPEDIVIRRETRNDVIKAIRQLPPRQAIVVYDRFYEDLSYPEISEKWGLPIGSIKTISRIAKRRLRGILRSPQDVLT